MNIHKEIINKMAKNISRANFLKTSAKGLGALATGVAFSGCASKLTEDLSKTPAQHRGYATNQEAMEFLRIQHPFMISNIEGYKMHIMTAAEMRAHAELRAKGNASVRQYINKDGASTTTHTRAHWTYTPRKQEILNGLLWEADRDGNMIIDNQEERTIGKTVQNEYFNQRK